MSKELAAALRRATALIVNAPDAEVKKAAAEDFEVTIGNKIATHGVEGLNDESRKALRELQDVIAEAKTGA